MRQKKKRKEPACVAKSQDVYDKRFNFYFYFYTS